MSDCREFEELTTPYVDGEGAPADRRRVERHLEVCVSCRQMVETEAAGRRLLRSHAAMLRVNRGATDRAEQRQRSLWASLLAVLTPVRIGTAALLAGAILVAFNRPDVIEAVGVIGDSACGAGRHYDDSSPAAARQCTLNCVAHGAQFVFVSQEVVYRISNQTFPALASLANARVSVTGVLEDGALTLARIELRSDPLGGRSAPAP